MATAIWRKCTIYVEGTGVDCPLCGVHVKSGERHECERPEKAVESKPVRKPRRKP